MLMNIVIKVLTYILQGKFCIFKKYVEVTYSLSDVPLWFNTYMFLLI